MNHEPIVYKTYGINQNPVPTDTTTTVYSTKPIPPAYNSIKPMILINGYPTTIINSHGTNEYNHSTVYETNVGQTRPANPNSMFFRTDHKNRPAIAEMKTSLINRSRETTRNSKQPQ